jgi:hypothetical protein
MVSSGVIGMWYRSKLYQLYFLEIYGILYIKKVTEFRDFSRNYTTRNSAEFRRNFSQFRTEYGIDGSKKTWNSVSTEFRGHPMPVALYCSPELLIPAINLSPVSLSPAIIAHRCQRHRR